ncbi:hypothetical protein [Flammeovirga agarivorans]|uniref:Uncharacterized protein n=1 Tax=Flammeovirga agarivorans TaxID=2726742 RepID=A0A7X8SK69_9BACT|nr:hypothetical protein [Flammeovirga agarivorans]NLR91736.1 hypothetical protein [Flammeovirga agarivorans]
MRKILKIIFYSIPFLYVGVFGPYGGAEEMRNSIQLNFKKTQQLKVEEIVNNDRGWLTFNSESNSYLIYLNHDSRNIIQEGDSIIHFAGLDSLYHKTKEVEVIPNEIIYYDPTSWLHELLGDTLDIEGRYGKKPGRQ